MTSETTQAAHAARASLSAQAIFDIVAKHLLTQKERSMMVHGEHLDQIYSYRGDGGMRCAVGCLIPDDVYDPKMEGRGVLYLVGLWPELACLKPHTGLLSALQSVHDEEPPGYWSSALKMVAMVYRLNPAVVDAHAQ